MILQLKSTFAHYPASVVPRVALKNPGRNLLPNGLDQQQIGTFHKLLPKRGLPPPGANRSQARRAALAPVSIAGEGSSRSCRRRENV